MNGNPLAGEHVPASSMASRRTWRVKWRYASPIILIHLVALIACLPWSFSWTGVILAVFGCIVFGGVGMNVGYHRLLTHRSFRARDGRSARWPFSVRVVWRSRRLFGPRGIASIIILPTKSGTRTAH